MKKLFRFFVFVIMAFMIVSCGSEKPEEVVFKDIKLAGVPSQLTYTEGESFNPTGLKVNQVMADGSSSEITDYTISPSGALTLNDKQIVVSYNGKEIRINIKVLEKSEEEPVAQTTHMILDSRGNYGGSFNKDVYGEGAPLNGEYDIKDSAYYHTVDWYEQTSTKTRTLIPQFRPYQQTMRDTSGLACAVAALAYDGVDVVNQYTEDALMRKYETLNGGKIFGKGCTAKGLKTLFEDLGYTASSSSARIGDATTKVNRTNAGQDLIKPNLEAGKFVFIMYQAGNGYQWYLVVGYDDMGTTDNFDDAVILMDPNDRLDHFQDGYFVITLARLSRWWMEIEVSNGGKKRAGEALVVTPKNKIEFKRYTEEKPIYEQTIYPKHLLPGGKYTVEDPTLPADETKLVGAPEVLDTPYFHSVDVYNLKKTENTHICEKFRPYLQTYQSSCALVSLMVTMNFYGDDIVTYNEDKIVKDYETLILGGASIEGKGTGAAGRLTLLQSYGYETEKNPVSTSSAKYLKTYAQFKEFVTSHIDAGVPIPVSMTPIGGHGVVVIGLDDMGTEFEYDDVIFVADSSDNWDHIRDGYTTYSAMTFWNQWYGGLDDTIYCQSFNIFNPKK